MFCMFVFAPNQRTTMFKTTKTLFKNLYLILFLFWNTMQNWTMSIVTIVFLFCFVLFLVFFCFCLFVFCLFFVLFCFASKKSLWLNLDNGYPPNLSTNGHCVTENKNVARSILAFTISLHAEIGIQSIKTLIMQMIRQVRKIRVKSLIGALDKFNIIHQHFSQKFEIFMQLEVFNDWCWVWLNLKKYECFLHSSINTQKSNPWNTLTRKKFDMYSFVSHSWYAFLQKNDVFLKWSTVKSTSEPNHKEKHIIPRPQSFYLIFKSSLYVILWYAFMNRLPV